VTLFFIFIGLPFTIWFLGASCQLEGDVANNLVEAKVPRKIPQLNENTFFKRKEHFFEKNLSFFGLPNQDKNSQRIRLSSREMRFYYL
jgi:hypothetical protein